MLLYIQDSKELESINVSIQDSKELESINVIVYKTVKN